MPSSDSRSRSSHQWDSETIIHKNDPSKADENGQAVYDHITRFPNRWSKYRSIIREPVAEFLGVCIMVIFGAGAGCQVVLSANPSVAPSAKGEYLSISFGWAVGMAMGLWVSAGISDGHINPAVTLAFAVFRGFPWKKVPVYIVSQLLGGLVGAAFVYWSYFHAIDAFEGGQGVRTLKTANIFSSYALDYVTNVSAFFDEFIGTAVLLIVLFAVKDKRNAPPRGLLPLVIFILFIGIGISLGMQTNFAINPARDLGPRILTSMAGWGKAVYTYRNQYWIWCPVMAPILGALVGGALYDALIYTGDDCIFNKPDADARSRYAHATLEKQRDQRMPNGSENIV